MINESTWEYHPYKLHITDMRGEYFTVGTSVDIIAIDKADIARRGHVPSVVVEVDDARVWRDSVPAGIEDIVVVVAVDVTKRHHEPRVVGIFRVRRS